MEASVRPAWKPERPRVKLAHFVLRWLVAATSLLAAAALLPGASVSNFAGAVGAVAVVAVMKAIAPPGVAAPPPPLTLLVGFVLVLLLGAGVRLAAGHLTGGGPGSDPVRPGVPVP